MAKTKNNLIRIIFLAVAIFLITDSIFALTASSENYSLGQFTLGITGAVASGENFEARVLTTAFQSSARNAETDSYVVNLGLFENTTYANTISILEYSISPDSSVVGSTIRLYINSPNSENVWLKVIAPNGQQQIINLVNEDYVNFLPTPSIVGKYDVVFYANNSKGYTASVIDSFELIEQTIISSVPSQASSSSGGGGGGSSQVIEKNCLWDCTPWSICKDEKQIRICNLIGECKVSSLVRPLEEVSCSEVLFDISLKIKKIESIEDNNIKLNLDLIENIGEDRIDVHIKYSIIKNNEEIFSQIETKAVQDNLSFQKEIIGLNLTDGEYIFRVDILYGNLQRAFAEEKFVIENGGVFDKILNTNLFFTTLNWLISFVIPLIFSSLILIKIFSFNGKRKKIFLTFVVIAFILVLSRLFLNEGGTFSGEIIFVEFLSGINYFVLFFILLVMTSFSMVFIKRKTLSKSLEKYRNRKANKNLVNNHLKNLIHKKVYTSEGIFIGKIEDIFLGKNKIDSLKVKLEIKRYKCKGLILSWKNVVGCGEIVTIKNCSLSNLEAQS